MAVIGPLRFQNNASDDRPVLQDFEIGNLLHGFYLPGDGIVSGRAAQIRHVVGNQAVEGTLLYLHELRGVFYAGCLKANHVSSLLHENGIATSRGQSIALVSIPSYPMC